MGSPFWEEEKKNIHTGFGPDLVEWRNKYTDFIVARARLKRPTNIAQEFDRKTVLSSNLYDASHIAYQWEMRQTVWLKHSTVGSWWQILCSRECLLVQRKTVHPEKFNTQYQAIPITAVKKRTFATMLLKLCFKYFALSEFLVETLGQRLPRQYIRVCRVNMTICQMVISLIWQL